MTTNIAEVRLDANVAKAIEVILRSQISGLPVVDALHRALADILTASEAEETPADAQIHKTIRTELHARGGMSNALINVGVHGGAVALRGAIPSQCDRQALHAIVESVPGVKAVHDHLIWIDRASGAFMLSPEDSAETTPPA